MRLTMKHLTYIAVAMLALSAGLAWNGKFEITKEAGLISSAEARRGYRRPPVSLTWTGAAARSVRRRAVVRAAVTSECERVVDAHGRVYTRCN